MTFNPFICTIVFGISESSNITIFKDFILEIIEFKITEKSKKKPFFATLASTIFSIRSLNKVILDNSDRPNRIVQMNILCVLYSVIVIKVFDVKVVYAIYPILYALP